LKIVKNIAANSFWFKKYNVEQKKRKKVPGRRNEYVVVDSFVRKESTKVTLGGGVFKATCEDCFSSFRNVQGLGSHHLDCNAYQARKSKEQCTIMQEIETSRDSTVFTAKNTLQPEARNTAKRVRGK